MSDIIEEARRLMGYGKPQQAYMPRVRIPEVVAVAKLGKNEYGVYGEVRRCTLYDNQLKVIEGIVDRYNLEPFVESVSGRPGTLDRFRGDVEAFLEGLVLAGVIYYDFSDDWWHQRYGREDLL